MELKSIIWLVILVIGIIVKIAESAKERKQQGGNFQAPRSSNGDEPILTWEEVFARSRSSEGVPTVKVKKVPVPQAKEYSVSSSDAEILAQQQQYQQYLGYSAFLSIIPPEAKPQRFCFCCWRR